MTLQRPWSWNSPIQLAQGYLDSDELHGQQEDSDEEDEGEENGAKSVPCPFILNPQGLTPVLPGLPVLFQ